LCLCLRCSGERLKRQKRQEHHDKGWCAAAHDMGWCAAAHEIRKTAHHIMTAAPYSSPGVRADDDRCRTHEANGAFSSWGEQEFRSCLPDDQEHNRTAFACTICEQGIRKEPCIGPAKRAVWLLVLARHADAVKA
jgi:hypothetical protein